MIACLLGVRLTRREAMGKAVDLIHVEGPVWLVPGEGRGRFPRSNSVLIRDGSVCALVDTGCGADLIRDLRRRVTVDLVINTHSHPDHTAGNHLFADVEIVVPEQCFATAGDLNALSERFFNRAELRPLWREFVRREMGFVDQAPSRSFTDGEEIVVGGARLQVLHTPGHSADHCCFYLSEHRVLLGADIDLTRFGPWYGHPESSLAQLRRSMDRVRALEPRVMVSAHRPPVRKEVDQALRAYARVIEEREQRLLDHLAGGARTLEQIVEAALIYGGFPYEPEVMRYWEGQMIGKHLEELVESGRVARGDRGYRAR
jgi:glyoxylase-like metal-dependent hydrolase (beta-lactamase superfamily II)